VSKRYPSFLASVIKFDRFFRGKNVEETMGSASLAHPACVRIHGRKNGLPLPSREDFGLSQEPNDTIPDFTYFPHYSDGFLHT
jgi:hypothetical protein